MENATIAAISTHPGKSALGIIRVSGKTPFLSFQNNSSLSGAPVDSITPRTVYRKAFDSHGALIDKPLVAVFKAPHSYTGEDMAKFHATAAF